ncbi:type IV pilin [Halopiger djelfimassiliensis]|uniref:type IV pilin n=1 Tax=Halopiger djelfimassiliensis TaxID=1293047 RepID=UPI000677FC3C|nr:type IV pilin N-terminal domain-containing protein [Halopiger djelfimassiliensis]
MDAKIIRDKLVGNDEERAVSPVIGVILMVAITVILAAVIAAFVLDMGDSIDQEAQAGVQMEFDSDSGELDVELTSEGNSEYWQLRGDYYDNTGGDWVSENGNYSNLSGAGDTLTIDCSDPSSGYSLNSSSNDETGKLTVVASQDGESWTNVGSQEWECGNP